MPLLTLDRISLAYGMHPLLDEASLTIDPGERVCLLGRNGEGKSTLLKIVSGGHSWASVRRSQFNNGRYCECTHPFVVENRQRWPQLGLC